MGDFLLGIQREQMAFGSVFFVSRAVARGSETLRRVPQQIWCQKNATFSSCPFWYIYTQSLTGCRVCPVPPWPFGLAEAETGAHDLPSPARGHDPNFRLTCETRGEPDVKAQQS